MCSKHWYLVPSEIRDEVNRLGAPGTDVFEQRAGHQKAIEAAASRVIHAFM